MGGLGAPAPGQQAREWPCGQSGHGPIPSSPAAWPHWSQRPKDGQQARTSQPTLPCLCLRSLRVPLEGLVGSLGPGRAGALGAEPGPSPASRGWHPRRTPGCSPAPPQDLPRTPGFCPVKRGMRPSGPPPALWQPSWAGRPAAAGGCGALSPEPSGADQGPARGCSTCGKASGRDGKMPTVPTRRDGATARPVAALLSPPATVAGRAPLLQLGHRAPDPRALVSGCPEPRPAAPTTRPGPRGLGAAAQHPRSPRHSPGGARPSQPEAPR